MLESHPGFFTHDVGLVRETLCTKFGATHFDLAERRSVCAAKIHWSILKELTLVSASMNAGADVNYAPAAFVRQYFRLGASDAVRFTVGSKTLELCRSTPSIIVPAHTALRIESRAAHEMLVLRLDQEKLVIMLRAMLGEAIPSDLIFADTVYPHDPDYRRMRQAILQFASELGSWGPDLNPFALAELGRAIIVRFLLCTHHSYRSRLDVQPRIVSSSQIKRLEDYIEANCNKPIDIQMLVAACGVSARSLFRTFKKARGISPTEFVKMVRLNRARRLLETASEDTKVTRIALDCGFQNLGYFANEYHRNFGELPSETLRRAIL